MEFNWKAMGIGLIITFVLGIFMHFFAAIIGGIVVGYLKRGNFATGAVNGGLSTGIAGFLIGLLLVLYLNSSDLTAGLVSMGLTSGDIVLIAIISAILAFLVFFIAGAVSGLIGTFIAKKKSG